MPTPSNALSMKCVNNNAVLNCLLPQNRKNDAFAIPVSDPNVRIADALKNLQNFHDNMDNLPFGIGR